MCAIFGFAGLKLPDGLERCAKAMGHRGPDAFGSHVNPEQGIYLAHCRLAIIDLSELGRQPMCNEDGTIWLSYNGEIYNFAELRAELEPKGHIFRSHTDSEVILHAYEEWGSACLTRFHGMFAFGLWDGRRGKLLLARDRVGIKPLYYCHSGGSLAFASEPKALLRLPTYKKGVNVEALIQYLIYGYIGGDLSIWQGISRLAPGCFLEFNSKAGTIREERYWQIEVRDEQLGEEEAEARLESLLTSAVGRQLVSDVPLGLFLSGGVDSSCVAASASQIKKGINSYTIGFEGTTRDERATARRSAERLALSHHEEVVSRDMFGNLHRLFDFFDEPLANTSMFPMFLVCEQARKHTTVVLSGDGGDEVFGGYDWYNHVENCRPVKKLAFLLGPILGATPLKSTELGRRCDRLEHYRRVSHAAFSIQELGFLMPDLPRKTFPEGETDFLREHWQRKDGPYKQWQHLDLETYLVDSNLVVSDRASMAHGLEVRVPLLDDSLVDFAFRLPPRLITGNGERKHLLRQLLRHRGLGHVAELPKIGFSCPMDIFWPRAEMKALLADSSLVRNGVLRAEGLAWFLDRANDPAWEYKLFVMAVLEQWSRRWLD